MRVETAHHPEVDELAAFVDGQLTGDRRQRMVEHLSVCAECRDLFGEAAEVVANVELEDQHRETSLRRRLLPAPWRRKAILASALAAGLLVVLLSPRIFELVTGPRTTLGAVTGELVPRDEEPGRPLIAEVSQTWLSHDWPRYRSLGEVASLSREERSFQLGVRVMELEIALRGGQGQLAQRMTYRLESLLGEDQRNEQVLYLYSSEEGVRGRLEAGVDPRSLTRLNERAAELLSVEVATSDVSPTERFWFELGLWARAAQLAAETGEDEFFAQRSNRRRLRALSERPLPAAVAAPIEQLVQLTRTPAEQLPEIQRQLDILVTSAGGGEPDEAAAYPEGGRHTGRRTGD